MQRMEDLDMETTAVSRFRKLLHEQLPQLRTRYGVASLGIFGSYLRNQQGNDSDLDVLVTFADVPSLFRLVELENCLSDLLGIKVDLVLKDNLKPHVGARVLAEVLPV
jgi:hypothetical protein